MESEKAKFKKAWLTTFVFISNTGKYKLKVLKDPTDEDFNGETDIGHYLIVLRAFTADKLGLIQELFAEGVNEVPLNDALPFLIKFRLPVQGIEQIIPEKDDEVEVVIDSFINKEGNEEFYLKNYNLFPQSSTDSDKSFQEGENYFQELLFSLEEEQSKKSQVNGLLIEKGPSEMEPIKSQNIYSPKRKEGQIERFFRLLLIAIAILFILWWIGRGIPPQPDEPWPFR